MQLDAHIHSTCSDGTLTVPQLVEKALQLGLGGFALTDHDYVDHLERAVAVGKSAGITVLPGVEISACDPQSQTVVHILGYGFGVDAPSIRQLCAPTLARRQDRSLAMMALVRQQHPGFDQQVCEQIAGLGTEWGSPVLYRQHVQAAMRRFGMPAAEIDAMHALEIDYPSMFDAIRAIHEDGGFAILAHSGLSNAWEFVPQLVEAGLDGIECLHPGHCAADLHLALELCTHHHLIASGGSDFHGERENGPMPGSYTVPEDFQHYFLSGHGATIRQAESMVYAAGAFLSTARAHGNGGHIVAEFKGGDHRDLVSACDHAVDRMIREALARQYPEDILISEEAAIPELVDGKRCWILDPIDGTTNFLDWGREYTISLACYEFGQPCFGLVYDVHGKSMFKGVHLWGMYNNNCRQPKPAAAVHVAGNDPLHSITLDTSLNTIVAFNARGIDTQALSGRLFAHRSCGCASLAIVRIALGEIQAYVSDRLRTWDWAAAAIMLGENGGCIAGLFGYQPDPLLTGKVPFLAAADSVALQALLVVFASAQPEHVNFVHTDNNLS